MPLQAQQQFRVALLRFGRRPAAQPAPQVGRAESPAAADQQGRRSVAGDQPATHQRLPRRDGLAVQGQPLRRSSRPGDCKGRRHAKRSAFQRRPFLNAAVQRRLPLLPDVAAAQQPPSVLENSPQQAASARPSGHVRAEARQPLPRPDQVVGQGGVQRRQIAGAAPRIHDEAAPRALPVQKLHDIAVRPDQDVLGIEVRVRESRRVHPGQGRAERPAPDGAAPRARLPTQPGAQVRRPGSLTDEKKGPTASVLAGRQPLRAADALAAQRLQNRALRSDRETKPKPAAQPLSARPRIFDIPASERRL